MTEAYPLQWPQHWPRTKYRISSAFKIDLSGALDELYLELDLLGSTGIVLSSNLQTRLDGRPLAKARIPTDPAVAAYFTFKGKQQCVPCDKWDDVRSNVRAVGLTIAALRGLERWGAQEMVTAAFSGFEALPPPSALREAKWKELLGLKEGTITADRINASYRNLSKIAHPDKGGSPTVFAELTAARDIGLREFG